MNAAPEPSHEEDLTHRIAMQVKEVRHRALVEGGLASSVAFDLRDAGSEAVWVSVHAPIPGVFYTIGYRVPKGNDLVQLKDELAVIFTELNVEHRAEYLPKAKTRWYELAG